MILIIKGRKWIIITDLREFTGSKIQEIKSQKLGPNNIFRKRLELTVSINFYERRYFKSI
jgi:hypothetical protein